MVPWVDDAPLIDGILIDHNKYYRTGESYRNRGVYRKWKKPIENQARIDLGYEPMVEHAE